MNALTQSETPRSPQTWLLDVGYPSPHERRYSVLCILDYFTYACLAMEIQESFRTDDIVRVLEDLAAARGAPGALMIDNSVLFHDAAIARWAARRRVQLVRPPQYAPWAKGRVERAIRSAAAGRQVPGSGRRSRHDRYDT